MLTRVVPEVAALVVVGSVMVEELTRVVPGIGARKVVETPPIIGIDMVLVLILMLVLTFRQGLFGPWQAYPASQHESKHSVDPGPHDASHLAPGRH